jgi:hypothetical protein
MKKLSILLILILFGCVSSTPQRNNEDLAIMKNIFSDKIVGNWSPVTKNPFFMDVTVEMRADNTMDILLEGLTPGAFEYYVLAIPRAIELAKKHKRPEKDTPITAKALANMAASGTKEHDSYKYEVSVTQTKNAVVIVENPSKNLAICEFAFIDDDNLKIHNIILNNIEGNDKELFKGIFLHLKRIK